MFKIGDRVRDGFNRAEWVGYIYAIYRPEDYWQNFTEPLDKQKEEWGQDLVYLIKLDSPSKVCTEAEYVRYFGSNYAYDHMSLVTELATPEKWLVHE